MAIMSAFRKLQEGSIVRSNSMPLTASQPPAPRAVECVVFQQQQRQQPVLPTPVKKASLSAEPVIVVKASPPITLMPWMVVRDVRWPSPI